MWKDAKAEKPEANKPVILFRTYRDLPAMNATGFTSMGYWNGETFVDDLYTCEPKDVKFWHPMPETPVGEVGE